MFTSNDRAAPFALPYENFTKISPFLGSISSYVYFFSRSAKSFVENSFILIFICVESGVFCPFIYLSVASGDFTVINLFVITKLKLNVL